MNKMRLLFLAIAFALFAWNAGAQTADDDAQLRQKINAAVMKVYDDKLAQEPGDYTTRFARAYQLFNMGNINDALEDVSTAIDDIPEKDKELLYDALLLRAKIYDKQNKLEDAYTDLQSAFAINSSNPTIIDMIAKSAYKRGDYTTAETNFNAILRQSPQNYDALYWLAKTAVKRADFTKAQEYCDRAVKLFPAESQVYLNRAEVFSEMQQYKVAAQDLILAMSVSSDESKAVGELVKMSDDHYDDVMNALQNSIDNAPSVGTFYYIRYSIAMRHIHYAQALKDLNIIIANNFFNDASIYYDQARCRFELMQYDAALESINQALAKENDAQSLLLKARIVQNQGTGKNYEEALGILLRASRLNPNDIDLSLATVRIYIAQRKNAEALALLNRLILTNKNNNELLLLRGWLSKYRLRDAETALEDFNAMLSNGTNMKSLRGFALHELGREDEARQWASDIIQESSLPGGEAYAMASALLSDIGDNDQALKYLESALANGFGSCFDVMVNEDPYVNLKLVRRHPDFSLLLSRYTNNFEVK